MKKSIPLLALILALGIYTAGPIVMKSGPFAVGVAHADSGDSEGGAGSDDSSDGAGDSNDGSDSADSNDDNGADDDVTGIDNPDDVSSPETSGAAKSTKCNWVGCAG